MGTVTSAPTVLIADLAIGESPRWHQGRLWFAHWGTGEILAVDPTGHAEVMGTGPAGLGWSIGFLADGTLLVTGETLRRRLPDGTLVDHADFSGVADHGWNEIVVDARDNVYVNGMSFDFLGGGAPQPGIIALARPDGSTERVAEGIEFPNGMAVTPDNTTLLVAESFANRITAFAIADDGTLHDRRVWADGVAPDGICLDAEGAVWTSSPRIRMATGDPADPVGLCVRVLEGGEVTDRIELDRFAFAYALGGEDGCTLFSLLADWRGVEQVDAVLADRTGLITQTRVTVPSA